MRLARSVSTRPISVVLGALLGTQACAAHTKRLEIDLRGQQPDTVVAIGRNDVLFISATNLNPLVFQYRVRLRDSVTSEGALLAFVKLALPELNLGSPTVLATAPSASTHQLEGRERPGGSIVGKSLACNSPKADSLPAQVAYAAEAALYDKARESDAAAWDWAGKIQAAERAFHKSWQYDSLRAFDPEASRDIVTSAAKDAESALAALQQQLAAYHAVDSLRVDARLTTQRVAQLGPMSVAAAGFNAKQECPPFGILSAGITRMGGDTASLLRISARADSLEERASLLVGPMSTVVNDPSRFSVRSVAGPYPDASVVTVRVERHLRSANDTSYVPTAISRIVVGHSRLFSLGAALVRVSTPVSSYGVTRRYVTPASAGSPQTDTTTGLFVVRTDSGQSALRPMVTLEGNLLSIPSDVVSGVHLVFGATVRKEGDTTRPEFLVGLGASTFGDLLTIGYGEYFGRTTQLLDGISVGSRAPTSDAMITSTSAVHAGAWLLSLRLPIPGQ